MHGRMYSGGLGAAVLISGIKKKNQNMIHTVLILISEIKKKNQNTKLLLLGWVLRLESGDLPSPEEGPYRSAR